MQDSQINPCIQKWLLYHTLNQGAYGPVKSIDFRGFKAPTGAEPPLEREVKFKPPTGQIPENAPD